MPVAERDEDGERTGGFTRWVGLYSLRSTDDEQAQVLFSWKDGLLSLISPPGAEWKYHWVLRFRRDTLIPARPTAWLV